MLRQVEENLQRLEEDADFREEYLTSWAQSRPKLEASSGHQSASQPKVDEKVQLIHDLLNPSQILCYIMVCRR